MTGSTSVQVVSQVVVLVNGLPLGVLGDLLPGGTVSLDTTSANMRTCSFQCLDTNGVLMPGSSGHGLFDPTGIEVMIEKGFMVDGVPTLWSQGIFGVTECDVAVGSGGSVSPGPVLTISGTDRSLRLSLNLFTDSFTTTQGFTAVQSIYQILSSRAPWVQTNISPSTAMIAQQTFTPGSDPWVAILGIAQSAGMVCYFDVDGILVVRPTPSAAGSPTVVAIQDGPDQLASSLTAAYSNSPGYNGVIVIGTNPDTNQPVSGSAYDMDPTSRTFAGGAYGYRPAQPSHSSAVTSNGQAAQMAAAMLPQVLGLTVSVAMDVLPIPFIDAYSLVYVANEQTQVTGTFILRSATIGMDYTTLDNMTVVPLGTPITSLIYNRGASMDALANAHPLPSGGYIYYPRGYGSGGWGKGLGGLLGFAGLPNGRFFGVPGHRGGVWNGGRVWHWTKNGFRSVESDA